MVIFHGVCQYEYQSPSTYKISAVQNTLLGFGPHLSDSKNNNNNKALSYMDSRRYVMHIKYFMHLYPTSKIHALNNLQSATNGENGSLIGKTFSFKMHNKIFTQNYRNHVFEIQRVGTTLLQSVRYCYSYL